MRVRGSAHQVLEKYLAMARDANSAGDRVAAENYLQHAEHYFRLLNNAGDQHGPNGRYRGNGRSDMNGSDRGNAADESNAGQRRSAQGAEGESEDGDTETDETEEETTEGTA